MSITVPLHLALLYAFVYFVKTEEALNNVLEIRFKITEVANFIK